MSASREAEGAREAARLLMLARGQPAHVQLVTDLRPSTRWNEFSRM